MAIVDFDAHFGNGTEEIVRMYKNPNRLFFFSIHLYDKDPATGYEFFPGTGEHDDRAHNIINVPVPPLWKEEGKTTRRTNATTAPVAGREAFRHGITTRLLPSLRAFNPQLILMSAGFDAAAGDVGNSHTKRGVGGMDLYLEDFEWVTARVLEVADMCCQGRVVSVLEGGYGCFHHQRRTNAAKKDKEAAAAAAAATATASAGGGSGGSGGASGPHGGTGASAEMELDRDILADAVCAHLSALVDSYGYV